MNIVLGVSGSIAAYRAADLARELMRQGHTIRACLTDAAQQFVTPTLFETLTGNPCLIDAFDEPETGRMAHIDWARQADLILVAPATANTINKLAAGIGDDMLTTLVLAATCPLVVAPAMNPQMYANEITQRSLKTLSARAVAIVEPQEGDVACGEHGQGKLAPNSQIVDTVQAVLASSRLLAGKRVVITSGPTQEPIDEVRFLSNRSSGKMGSAIARAALLMGAEVTIVSGPVQIAYPLQAKVVRVGDAVQMLEATINESAGADIVIGAAAVADYRPADPVAGKMRRGKDNITLTLVPNPDIIAQVARSYPSACVVGFAAEPTSDLSVAMEKLVRKGLFAIAANDVSAPGTGFDAEDNDIALIRRDVAPVMSGRRSKLACALWLLDNLAR
ncbi:MAG: bifunctional phosphopantothenoylcysteine decarboxylase/phosphopantothenate--cysteine ligase CoaBC [Fimbriimonas sp.]|nr:bifunctional phosphopantothenoylcysteine decarboxylase/phosphopantothenate--cysteine ligase CoaBC [Fimbriimonas sp.]